jgi:endonuclease G
MSKRLILSGIFTLTLIFQNSAFAKIEKILGVPLNQNNNLIVKLETENSEIILSRHEYVLSYNKFKRTPNYVAWKLEASQIGSSGRTNNFSIDTELENYLVETSSQHAVDSLDYRGSCFDRGHQIPSADRTDNITGNETTFLMSNMIPQTAYLNRVSWAHLEQYSRDLVQKQGKKLFIIAGPVYDKEMGAIGPNNDIQIPSKNFKVIYILNAEQTPENIDAQTPSLAVVIPNMLQNGSTDLSDKKELCKPLKSETSERRDWEKYKTTIDNVEKMTGLKFGSPKI